MLKYHLCGHSIWVLREWNGLDHCDVFSDGSENSAGALVTHCPKCGEILSANVLSSESSSRKAEAHSRRAAGGKY
jgi:hypothetical protein